MNDAPLSLLAADAAALTEPVNGMTAASTPAAGSQAIIHANNNFRNSFIGVQIELSPVSSSSRL
jgi:hypothetical protein